MSEKYEKLTSVNPAVKVLEPYYSKDNKAVRFGFLKGKTLAEILGEQITGKKAPVEALKAAMDRVFGQAVLKKEPFTPTDQFKEVFGDSEEILSLQDTSYEVSNIDGLFENLMETQDGFIAWIMNGYLTSRSRQVSSATVIWFISIISMKVCWTMKMQFSF